MRNVLFLAYYFPPINTSGAFRASRFFKYLPEFGYNCHVLCHGDPVQVSAKNVHPVVQAAKIWSIPGLLDATVKVAQKMGVPYGDRLAWVPPAVAASRKLLAHEDIAVIISTSPPLATHLVAMYLKDRYRLKWIADFRDPLPDELDGRFVSIYKSAMEGWILRKADAVVANTNSAAERLFSLYPRWREKIAVIWNGYDPEEDVTVGPAPSRNYRILTHVGDLYGPRHPARLLASIRRLGDRGLVDCSKLQIHLIGPVGEDVEIRLASFSDLIKNQSLIYNGQTIPRKEALQKTADADFLLLLDMHAGGFALPAKLIDYLRCGRPILAFTHHNSPAEHVLSESGVPYTCIYEDAGESDTDNKVHSFLTSATPATGPSPWFWKQFNTREQTETLSSILDGLLA